MQLAVKNYVKLVVEVRLPARVCLYSLQIYMFLSEQSQSKGVKKCEIFRYSENNDFPDFWHSPGLRSIIFMHFSAQLRKSKFYMVRSTFPYGQKARSRKRKIQDVIKEVFLHFGVAATFACSQLSKIMLN